MHIAWALEEMLFNKWLSCGIYVVPIDESQQCFSSDCLHKLQGVIEYTGKRSVQNKSTTTVVWLENNYNRERKKSKGKEKKRKQQWNTKYFIIAKLFFSQPTLCGM